MRQPTRRPQIIGRPERLAGPGAGRGPERRMTAALNGPGSVFLRQLLATRPDAPVVMEYAGKRITITVEDIEDTEGDAEVGAPPVRPGRPR